MVGPDNANREGCAAVRRSSYPAVTIVDVARAAGVSKSTAGRALAGAGEVSARTREKVARIAAELGYRPNSLARSMITGNTQTVGVVIPDVSNRFFAAVLQSIARTVRKHGYEVLVSSTDGEPELERRSVEVLAAKRVDGLIMASLEVNDTEHLKRLTEDGIPLVLLDRAAPDVARASFVSVNNAEASRLAVNHLITLGHRDIAIISEARLGSERAEDATGLRPSAMRLAGYVQAMRSAGLAVVPELVRHSAYSSAISYDTVRTLLRTRPEVTAIYCTDNVLSAGAFAAVQDSGLRSPDDVSLIGFDDHEWATLVRPRLTVVEQPIEAIGVAAAEDLLDAIADRSRASVTRLLPAELVVRDSTAPPRR